MPVGNVPAYLRWLAVSSTHDRTKHKTANGALHDAADRLYRGVLYFTKYHTVSRYTRKCNSVYARKKGVWPSLRPFFHKNSQMLNRILGSDLLYWISHKSDSKFKCGRPFTPLVKSDVLCLVSRHSVAQRHCTKVFCTEFYQNPTMFPPKHVAEYIWIWK
jgi:hypothetical protein